MAKAIVDDLKPVEVEKEYGELVCWPGRLSLDRSSEMIHESDSIGKICQRVMKRIMSKLFFSQFSLCNVTEAADPADRLALKELRLRIKFVYASVVKIEELVSDGQRVGEKSFKCCGEEFGIRNLRGREFRKFAGVLCSTDLRRHAPDLEELLIEGSNLHFVVDNDYAIGS